MILSHKIAAKSGRKRRSPLLSALFFRLSGEEQRIALLVADVDIA
jgi:hypothetical protein